MSKKWFMPLILSISIIISLIVGFSISKFMFGTAFIAFELDGHVFSYALQRGQISVCKGSFPGSVDDGMSLSKFQINLDGIHNNKDAIDQITNQVHEADGRIISSMVV